MNEDRGEQYGDFPRDYLGKRKRTTGQKVGIGCGVMVVGLVALGAIGAIVGDPKADGNAADPTVTNASVAAPSPVASATADAAVKAAAADAASDVLLTIRQSYMPVAFCAGEIANVRTAADRVIAGSATAIDAYGAAHTAERDCQKVVVEWSNFDKQPFKDAALNGIYGRTMPACQKVSSDGLKAAKVAKELMDGEATLKKGQQFRDLHIAMTNKTAECKLGLQGLAERAGVPSQDVDFLQL